MKKIIMKSGVKISVSEKVAVRIWELLIEDNRKGFMGFQSKENVKEFIINLDEIAYVKL